MPCGPGVASIPGEAPMNAFTVSRCPSIAAEKMVGRAPWVSSVSAISRLPTCEAAPIASSQSPNPQSQAARASVGRAASSSLTRARFPWATETISRTRSAGWLGKAESGAAVGGAAVVSADTPGTFRNDGAKMSAEVVRNDRRESDIGCLLESREAHRPAGSSEEQSTASEFSVKWRTVFGMNIRAARRLAVLTLALAAVLPASCSAFRAEQAPPSGRRMALTFDDLPYVRIGDVAYVPAASRV